MKKTVAPLPEPVPAAQTQSATRVAVVGAGFGGLSATLELAELKKRHKLNLDITLIDRNEYQLFTPDLYEIASATQDIKDEQDLKDIVCLDVRTALGAQAIHFVQASVDRIDTHNQEIHTTTTTLPYDYLIIALGSEPFYFNIPGMKEHSISFKWIEDAIRIRTTVFKKLETQKQVHVLVCGAGPSGVELAAELMRACREQAARKCFSITIVEGQPAVLPIFSKSIQRTAAQRLRQLNINLKTDFLISKAEAGKVVSTQGETLDGDVIIWAGGVVGSHVLATTGLTLNKRGQAVTHQTLQSADNENIFVVGDAAELQDGSKYAPQTAHEAVLQGPHAARNLVRHLLGKPMKKHHLTVPGTVITLGGKRGIVAFTQNLFFTGLIGWLVRKYVDLRHFRSVLPFMRACSVWYDGVRIMGKND